MYPRGLVPDWGAFFLVRDKHRLPNDIAGQKESPRNCTEIILKESEKEWRGREGEGEGEGEGRREALQQLHWQREGCQENPLLPALKQHC